MSTKTIIFLVLVLIAIIVISIIIVRSSSSEGPQSETTTTTSQTTGLTALLGGFGEGLSGAASAAGDSPEGAAALASILGLSDERHKNNINKVSKTGWGEAYNTVDTIDLITYSLVSSNGHTNCLECNRERLGFSAQEIEKINPNLIVIGKDGTKYIDYAQMVALNTGAIKSIQENLSYLKGLVSSDAVQGGGPTNTRVM